MAKTIKFNLMCDGYPCRNIEDVQEHFCIEDMLEYYESGLLKRWLEVRGFKDELAEVEAIEATEVLQITEELIRIFEILTDEDKVKEAVSLINYQKKRQATETVNEQTGYQSAAVLSNFISGYDSIVKEMMDRSTPSNVLQQLINTLATDYKVLFDKNIYALFTNSLKERPLVILNLLCNEHSRKYLVPEHITISNFGDTEFVENCNVFDIMTISKWDEKDFFNERLPSEVVPTMVSALMFNELLYADDDVIEEMQSIFENELNFASLDDDDSVTTLESPGTRCLVLDLTSRSSSAIVIDGAQYEPDNLEPLQVLDGLRVYSEYGCRIAYFKVDD